MISRKKPSFPVIDDPGSAIDGRLPPETNYRCGNNNSVNRVVPTIRRLADVISKLRAEINEKTTKIQELERENAEMKNMNNEVHEAAVIFKDQFEELEKKSRVQQQKLDETTAELDNLKKTRLDDREIVAKVQQEVDSLKLETEKWEAFGQKSKIKIGRLLVENERLKKLELVG
uniref:Uncharacterized protein n=1 Tax=Panagrolaimus sp. JU765 TaxID=591449 RepID=A0AC34RB29_9BILA